MGTKTDEVAAVIEDQIAHAGPGGELPSEAALMNAAHASRHTVRQAYARLEVAGKVEGGQGTRRRVPRPFRLDINLTRPSSRVAGVQEPTLGADSWAHDVTAQGGTPTEDPPRLRGALRGGVEREVLRRVNGRPHNLACWWFPEWLAVGTDLERPADVPGGTVPYLAKIGHEPASFTGLAWIQPPTPDQVTVLSVPRGVQLLVEERHGFDAENLLVFSSVVLWRGDGVRLAWATP